MTQPTDTIIHYGYIIEKLEHIASHIILTDGINKQLALQHTRDIINTIHDKLYLLETDDPLKDVFITACQIQMDMLDNQME